MPQRFLQEIDRLVLLNASTRFFSTLAQRLRPNTWLAILALAVRSGNMHDATRCTHRLTCNQSVHSHADMMAWQLSRCSAPVSLANALRKLAAAARFASAV